MTSVYFSNSDLQDGKTQNPPFSEKEKKIETLPLGWAEIAIRQHSLDRRDFPFCPTMIEETKQFF